MVAREGRYFGRKFQGKSAVTQGYPLSPTVSNVVGDAVLQNWLSLVVDLEVELVPEGFGRVIQRMTE